MKKLLILLIVLFAFGAAFAALTEGFEGTTFPPEGWRVINGGGANTWVRSSSAYHSGSYGASIMYNATAHDDYLITPKLAVTTSNYTFSFWARSSSSTYLEAFDVKLSTGTNNVADFTVTLAEDITAPYAWTQFTYDLQTPVDYTGQNVYLAVRARSTDELYLFLDDFSGPDIYVANDPEPTNHVTDFAAGTIGYTSIPLTWTGSTGAQLPAGYLIQAIKVGTGSYVSVTDTNPVANDAVWTDGNAAINVAHVVGANTYTFTGLVPNTAYEFKIWPYTNSGALINYKVDDPIPTVNASTLDPTQPLDYSQDFNSGTSLSAINWTGDMYISSTHGNAGTNGLTSNLWSSNTSCNAVTPPIGPMTDDCQILFDYRIVNYSGYPATGTTLGASDKIEVQVSTDSGANFTTIYTIDSTNHVTSNAFATLNLPVTAYDGDIILVKFLSTWGAGDYYVDIDNVIVREAPLAGILTVSPNPVECGNGYVGFDKNVQVSLTNTGVAAFNVSTIALEDYTNFDLADLPTLPVTINPGDPAVTFTVVFNPTVAGALTTNLLINDTRLNSSIVVNGTGVDPLVGEICENPYLATLPLVDYAGTTAGYANDYTSAMFTGLGSTSYVGGKDWVAKITIPSAGMLDISLANPSGDATYYYPGMFLVNTIPSLASPAAVLAQAYASTAPINITDAIVAAGDYYLIVDNWPSPASINFVLNISFEAVTSAPNPATLVSPLDDAINVPLTQTLNWSSGGGYVEGYRLSLGTVDPYAVIVDDEDLEMATTYDPVLAYSTEYWWTVTPYNYLGDATPVTQWTFTTMADPTVIIPPDYLTNFETWPATNWSQMNYLYGGTPVTGGSWGQDDWLNVTSPIDKAAKINIYYTHNSWLVTPPIQVPGGDYVLEFDLALMHWSTQSTPVIAGEQADDRLLLVMSDNADMSSPTTLMEWNNTGSSNVFDNISPTGQKISYPLAGITGTKHFAWYAESITDTAGDNDLMVNNVMIRIPPTAPEAPLLVYPGTDATDLPKTGFDLSWQNNPLGLEPDYFVVYMWTDAQGEFGGPFWETADASVTTLNPTVVIPEGETEPLTFAYDDRWNWTVSAVAGATEVIADSRWFVIQSDPTITISHTQSFGTDATPVWPAGWTQSYQDGVTSNRWTVSATNNAGGTANEMKCTWEDAVGISRLITPPINTDGIANFSAQFNHYFNDFAAGATAKVQYSHDLNTWYDTNWTLASGGGDDLGLRTALVLGINQPITYVAWVVDGDHYQFDYWYVDDVVLDLLPTHDVAPISIFTPESEVVDALTPLTPSVQVANLGANAETFTVTATWDTYTNTQTVTNLGIGQTATVTFATFTPNTYAAQYFTVTTNLATDVNTANDVLQTPLITLPLDRPALASNLWTDYLVGFNLKDPGTLTDLIDKSAYQSLYAGDWMNGKWYACEDYDDVNLVGGNFWQIDPPAGTMTDLGDGTTSMHGLAWDDVNGVLYGHDAANLYTLNPATGAILTTVGPHGITYEADGTVYDGLVISIAYDNYTQTLYAVELGNASLYTLNVTTGAATKVGAAEDWLGIDVNYAQDMAFDQDTGLLYLAGYTNSTQGALYWIDTTYGNAWKVGPFQGSSEMDAFAIPYGDAFVGSPDVTIAADGTLSWPAINGAAGYYVYAADDPYGTYTKIATVYDLSWLDPNFPETMKFYHVVAFGGRAASNNQADVNINPTLRKTGTRAAGEVTASPADRNQRQLKK
ncbi:MAG TPA: choice-of-anchor J domain-containing protein [Candidatus Syntrophosphaera sp.]|nr:choice-of-anchor J domain-containing protein [Candidatus Syntrophosphaera sp.]